MTALSQKKGTTQSEGPVDALNLDASWGPGAKRHSASGRQRPQSGSRLPPSAPRGLSPASRWRVLPEGGRRLLPGFLLARGDPSRGGRKGEKGAGERQGGSLEVPPQPEALSQAGAGTCSPFRPRDCGPAGPWAGREPTLGLPGPGIAAGVGRGGGGGGLAPGSRVAAPREPEGPRRPEGPRPARVRRGARESGRVRVGAAGTPGSPKPTSSGEEEPGSPSRQEGFSCAWFPSGWRKAWERFHTSLCLCQ